jgi:hypothetical protein
VRRHALPVLALVAAIFALHGGLATGERFLYEYDTVQNHYPRFLVLREAYLERGAVPLWTRYLNGGTPFFAIPETPVFYPPVVGLLVALSPVAALNFSLLLHMTWGAVGAYAYAWRALRHRPAALLAALYFSLSFFGAAHFLTLPPYGWALAWTPFAAILLARILDREGGAGSAIGLGLVLALQVHSGGLYVHQYTLLYLGAYAGLRLAFERGRGGLRAASLLAVAGVVWAGLSAVRILPFLEWLPLTNRARGLSYDVALTDTIGLRHLENRYLSWPLLALLVPAIASVHGRREPALQLAIVALALAIACGLLYRPLFELVPGFRQQRDATRAWTMAHLGAGLLLGSGLQVAWAWTARRAGRVAALAAGGALFAGAVASMPRELYHELDRMRDAEKILRGNGLYEELAAESPASTSRIHALEVTFDGDPATAETLAKRTPQALTVHHGLESLESHLGAWWYPAVAEDFLQRSREWPTRAWGILNVRWVTAETPLPDLPEGFPAPSSGFPALPLRRSAREFRLAFPSFAMGPHLYENPDCLPRAYVARGVGLVAGDARAVREAVLEILARPDVDLRRAAIVQAGGRTLAAVEPGLAALATATVEVDGAAAGAREARTAPDLDAFAARLASAREPIVEAPVVERGQNDLVIALPRRLAGGRESGVLVLAELFHLFPGWEATATGSSLDPDGVPLVLHASNGVATAVVLPPGSEEVSFRYRPASFRRGAWVSAGTAAAVVLGGAFLWGRARRDRRAARGRRDAGGRLEVAAAP